MKNLINIEPLESRSYFSVDLTDSVSVLAPLAGLKPGKSATLSVEVVNDGTTPAIGKVGIEIGLSATSDGASLLHPTTIVKGIHLKAGAHVVFHLAEKVPVGFEPGAYYAVADVDPGNTFSETNVANNSAVSSNTLTVLDPYPDILGTWSGTIKVTRGLDKGLVVASVTTFLTENQTNGAITGDGTNHYPNGVTTSREGSGTITTTGAITTSGEDVPVDATGVFHNKGKIAHGVWSGTYTNAVGSGTFRLTFDGLIP